MEETYVSLHHETPQQTIARNNADVQNEVQTNPPEQPNTFGLTIRERLARSVQLRNRQREAEIETQQARTAVLNSHRQCFDNQSRYYEIAAESQRLYNENVRLRNEYLTNNLDNFLAFERRHPPAQLPPRHELAQNRVNPQDPNFDIVQHIDYLLEANETQQNPNPNQNLNQTR